jgi:hypothetical protein
MPDKPEDKARKTIDDLLSKAGWTIQDRDLANLSAARGVAIREFPLKSGYGFADYLLYVDGAPAGVVEAKKEGETLTGYEIQTEKYSVGQPDVLKPYCKGGLCTPFSHEGPRTTKTDLQGSITTPSCRWDSKFSMSGVLAVVEISRPKPGTVLATARLHGRAAHCRLGGTT